MVGKFYGIGVGPGDPELITVKAVNILKNIDVVVCPEGKKDTESIAFNIAKDYLSDDMQTLKLHFPMTYNENTLNEKWKENAQIIADVLRSGKNIAFLTLGDPSVYSTYMYLLPFLRERDIDIETIPGITSFCASASRVNIPLASGDETLCILPLRRGLDGLDEILDNFDNIVIMKPSHDNKKLADKINERKLNDNFVMISKCSNNEEEISHSVGRLRDQQVPYLSTVIIKKGGIR
ncbi:precorrin-2 C(20)-methyltransferase [Brassicibacter mesophilus]|uniref:precorrin-2 C(20)-methyltransferase n=1 Tax=Brassicibacter mesophilus TaxID=745119 RepID=UPI003D1FB075